MSNYIKTGSVTVDAVNPTKASSAGTFGFNQGDLNEDQITIQLTFSNTTVDLTTATAVEIFFQQQGGSVVKQDLTNGLSLTNAAKGQLLLSLNSQTTSVPGTVTAEVHVTYPDNQIIVFNKFTFQVDSSLSGGKQSLNSYQSLLPLQFVSSESDLPTASVNNRGATFFVLGSTGTADVFVISVKLADDTYAWMQIGPSGSSTQVTPSVAIVGSAVVGTSTVA